MNPSNAYEVLKPIFTQISELEYIKRLHTPIKIITDGNIQVTVAKQDSQSLAKEGMDINLIKEVEQALHAFSGACSLYASAVTASDEVRVEWEALKNRAYTLRKDLFRYGLFGCKKNNLPHIGSKLKEIIESVGDDDMIYDLLNCNLLFTAHPHICKGLTKFNPFWVEEALELHNTLSDLKAKNKNPETTHLLHQYSREVCQSYTYYHRKVSELRDWGQLVFDGEERKDKYKALFRQ